MSQDPIRQAAEQLLIDIRDMDQKAEEGVAFVHEYVELVEAFAKSQRAAVWEEVIKEAANRSYQIGLNEPLHTNYLYLFKAWCSEQRAQSLEGAWHP